MKFLSPDSSRVPVCGVDDPVEEGVDVGVPKLAVASEPNEGGEGRVFEAK